MITIVHFWGAYVIWKGQVRFVRFGDQPNTINIENSEIGVLLELPSLEFHSQEEIQMALLTQMSQLGHYETICTDDIENVVHK